MEEKYKVQVTDLHKSYDGVHEVIKGATPAWTSRQAKSSASSVRLVQARVPSCAASTSWKNSKTATSTWMALTWLTQK